MVEVEEFSAAKRFSSSSSSCLYPGSTYGGTSDSIENIGRLGCLAGREGGRGGEVGEEVGKYVGSTLVGWRLGLEGVEKVGNCGISASWRGRFVQKEEESQW